MASNTHRVHVVPWLRGPGGRVFISGWLAITVGRDIWCWRELDEVELTHELVHVGQWRRYGTLFVLHYALASLLAVAARGHWYRDNRFEVEARAGAARAQAKRSGSMARAAKAATERRSASTRES